jgi:enoyl-CoA hydratase/carnithine racemase
VIDLERHDDGLWVVSINRPDKANSLTKDMLLELTEIAVAAKEAKALVLTGMGKVFSAGADLDEARAGLATDGVWERLSGAVAELPCFTIAALNGTLAGGAMGMALACDIRIAVPNAKFFYPVMKLGFLPQPSDPKRMSALIGPARTKLVLMGGQKIAAQDAYDFGLVERLVEPDELMPTAHSLCEHVLSADPKLAAQIKSLCD